MSTLVLDPFQIFPSDVIPRNGLVAEYLFNNNYLDTSVNGYDGVNNGTTFVTDKKGNANAAIQLVFTDGQYVNIDAILAGLGSTTVGTRSYWVSPFNATPSLNRYPIGFGDTNANTRLYEFNSNVGKLNPAFAVTGTLLWNYSTDNAVFSDGTWVHILVKKSNTDVSIKINNVFVAQGYRSFVDKTKWFNDAPGLDNGRIGCLNYNSLGNSFFYSGKIDNVRFYDRFTTDDEDTQLYNELA